MYFSQLIASLSLDEEILVMLNEEEVYAGMVGNLDFKRFRELHDTKVTSLGVYGGYIRIYAKRNGR